MSSIVSIIMNCRNGEKHLREAINSIYAQTFRDWQVIFFDNASTDNSAKIAKSYDEKIKYIYNEKPISLGAARKAAVDYADGEWIAFLDTDDIWFPHKLTHQLGALKGTDFIACYAGIQEISQSGDKIRDVIPIHTTGKILEGLLRQFEVNMVTSMVKRDAIRKYCINFDSSMTASEEYNLFIRLSAKGAFLVQRDLLGFYRLSADSLTDRQIGHWALERRRTLNSLEVENPGIKNLYRDAFSEAQARACYYEAQYLISIKLVGEARKILKQIKGQDYKYACLYYLSRFPYLWQILHKKTIRSRVLAFIKFHQFFSSK